MPPLVAASFLKSQPLGGGIDGALVSMYAYLRSSTPRLILIGLWVWSLYPKGTYHILGKTDSTFGPHRGMNPLRLVFKIRRELEKWFNNRYSSDSPIRQSLPHPGFRLHLFPDGGGKIRVIGIGNVLVQGLLFPIHNAIFRKLRRISEDLTFDQGKIRQHYAR